MSLADLYAKSVGSLMMDVDASFATVFDFRYGDGRDEMMRLYDKGKRQQWNVDEGIDWSVAFDPEDPLQLPEAFFPLYRSPLYLKMTAAEKARARRHYQAWTTSQFLHGEQGALFCAAKIVQQVPDMEAKLYASSQVIDEARHVEVFSRLLKKIGTVYGVSSPLKILLRQILGDSRWDMTYLGMQVVIEGLALAAFAGLRDYAQNPLAARVNAYVMRDEARHVAFGRLALREFYPQLSTAERAEREDFLITACRLMRDRFEARSVWRNLGLPVDRCVAHLEQSKSMGRFRRRLFARIVPVVRDIGLWSPRVRDAFEAMGVLAFARIDVDAMQASDEAIAAEFAARQTHIETMADYGRAG